MFCTVFWFSAYLQVGPQLFWDPVFSSYFFLPTLPSLLYSTYVVLLTGLLQQWLQSCLLKILRSSVVRPFPFLSPSPRPPPLFSPPPLIPISKLSSVLPLEDSHFAKGFLSTVPFYNTAALTVFKLIVFLIHASAKLFLLPINNVYILHFQQISDFCLSFSKL